MEEGYQFVELYIIFKSKSICVLNFTSYLILFIMTSVKSGLPAVREKSGKKYFFKVSEKSGNFTKSQGIL